MSGISASTNPTAHAQPSAQPSVRGFIVQHKLFSGAMLALLVGFVALLVPAIIGSGSWKVADSSACSTWSSANGNQQAAYARLYVREHGPLPSGAASPSSIIAAINNGCTAAYAYDEADSVNVVQAINGRY